MITFLIMWSQSLFCRQVPVAAAVRARGVFCVGFVGLFILLAATVSGCSHSDTSGSAGAKRQLRIGYQKSSGLLNRLRKDSTLEKRLGPQVQVIWQEFPAGPQMLEALNFGSVDFGTSGEVPPVFAQAAGAPLLYVALEPVGPTSEAILVREDAPYRSIADLKGKRIALNKASNVHFFLVQALEAAGMTYRDIDPVFLPPADARAAFEGGRVDAWAIWDPFLTAALKAGGARVLLDGQGLVENHQFYFVTRKLAAEQAEVVPILIEELTKVNDWAESHKSEFVDFLTATLELDREVLRSAEERRGYGILPVDDQVVAYQQRIADTFLKLGLLPHEIRVAEAIWKWPATAIPAGQAAR